MTDARLSALQRQRLKKLRSAFGERLQENVVMAHYTTAKIGGSADALLVANSYEEMESSIHTLWELDIPFRLLGGGSNLLVSDAGIREVVIINHTRNIKINSHVDPPTVWAESGVNLSSVVRRVALRGYSGLEWATGIPGSVGGAVYGNAGAFGHCMQDSLLMAEILHREIGKLNWSCEQMQYSYRSSILKRGLQEVQQGFESPAMPENSHNQQKVSSPSSTPPTTGTEAIILAACIKLQSGNRSEIMEKMEDIKNRRMKRLTPGFSMGSVFKNPPGEYAGKLIEAAGLKGFHIGDAEISPVHANLFINKGHATAAQVWQLIQTTQKTVEDRFGIQLELEIERIGDWSSEAIA